MKFCPLEITRCVYADVLRESRLPRQKRVGLGSDVPWEVLQLLLVLFQRTYFLLIEILFHEANFSAVFVEFYDKRELVLFSCVTILFFCCKQIMR